MSKNKKLLTTAVDQLTQAGQHAGYILMTAAAVAGMLELPNHENSRVVVPTQPSFAFAGENDELQNNPIRREKESEEGGSHYISYRVAQRSQARSGRK